MGPLSMRKTVHCLQKREEHLLCTMLHNGLERLKVSLPWVPNFRAICAEASEEVRFTPELETTDLDY